MTRKFPGGDPKAASTGVVRAGWMDRTICILAELEGENVSTRATHMNEMLWLMGECFEIFLKFEDDDRYLEFHIAPNNCVLQLLFPSYSFWQGKPTMPARNVIEEFTIKKPAFISRAWKNKKSWAAFAMIDLNILQPGLATLEGRELGFLFGRYHYPELDGTPILSCSGALSQLNFHRQEDWGTLRCSSVSS